MAYQFYPASASNLNIKFTNQLPGTYHILLVNSEGQTFASESFGYNGGVSIKKLSVNVAVPQGFTTFRYLMVRKQVF